MSATMLPILDGHNDTLLNLYLPDRGQGRSFFEHSDVGHIDLPRAREGGLAGGFFAIFVPNPETPPPRPNNQSNSHDPTPTPAIPIDLSYAQRMTNGMIAQLLYLQQQAPEQIRIATSVDDISYCLENDIRAAILHFEGADCIDANLDALEVYYAAGLRSLGLVWSRPNLFATGVPFAYPASPDYGPGLTDVGRKLVCRCNERGILIDLSHLNEKGFWDVAELSSAPLVATHSAVHAICPSSRNLTDAQIDVIGKSGGIIGVNFCVAFIRPDGQNNADTPLSVLVDHVRYITERIGIDHVALGSDFDGAKMPDELHDVSGLPKLLDALQDAGYTEEDLKKITHQNWLRVLRTTWR